MVASSSDVPIVLSSFVIYSHLSIYDCLYLNQKLMGYKLILSLLFLVVAQTIIPSTDINVPTKKSNFQSRQPALADTTVPYSIETPNSIREVADILIQKGDNCEVVNVDPIIQRGSYINFPTNFTEVVSSSWQVEIMSFVLSETLSKMYVLLDNGTLLTSPFRTLSPLEQVKQINHKFYARQALGAIDTWFETQQKLILFDEKLFLLGDQKLWNVKLYDMGYWQKDVNPIKQNVLKAEVINQGFYILTSTSLFQLVNNQVKTIRSGEKFIDFTITNNLLYLLIKDTGILQIDFSQDGINQQTSWQIEEPEHAKQIRSIDNTIFVIYQIQRKNYLAEYFIQQSNLIINKYYHNYYSIRDIYLTSNYAVIDSYSSYIVLHHSINRNSFNNFEPLQFLYKSRGTKITGIQLLKTKDGLSYIIGAKTSINQYSIPTYFQGTITKEIKGSSNVLALQCTSHKSIPIPITAIYKGLCNQQHSAKQFYCQTKVQIVIKFEYNFIRELQRNQNKKFIIWIVLLVFTVFAFIFCLACTRKLQKIHKKMKDDFENLRNKKEQHSLNMEQTFNKEVPQ